MVEGAEVMALGCVAWYAYPGMRVGVLVENGRVVAGECVEERASGSCTHRCRQAQACLFRGRGVTGAGAGAGTCLSGHQVLHPSPPLVNGECTGEMHSLLSLSDVCGRLL